MNLFALRRLFATEPRALLSGIVRRLRGNIIDTHSTPPEPFDQRYGIDAGGFIGWRSLYSGQKNDAFNAGYLATIPDDVRRALSRIVRPHHYCFVDIGCGKGRAMIVASEFTFKEIIGVEISPILVARAVENIEIVRADFPKRPFMRVVHSDAVTFVCPQRPLVIFLAHPFAAPVMRRFVKSLIDDLRSRPREVIIIYFNAKLASLFDGVDALERADEMTAAAPSISRCIIWRTRSPRPAIIGAARADGT
jgi:SAM-dependent methyltransferase